jgi:hypothetical protein
VTDVPISTDLLKAFQAEAGALADGTTQLGDALGSDSGVVEACRLAFRNLLGAELGVVVTSFSQEEKDEALEALEDEDDGALDEFVEAFGEFCDRWPDVLGASYGGSRADFREFRHDVIPMLLSGLYNWALTREHAVIAAEIRDAERSFSRALHESRTAEADDYED